MSYCYSIAVALFLCVHMCFAGCGVVGEACTDYVSVSGGPALSVYAAEQSSDGSWYVLSNDRRVWRWRDEQWTMLVGGNELTRRPLPSAVLSDVSSEQFYFLANKKEIYHSNRSSYKHTNGFGSLPSEVVDSRMYGSQALLLTTTGTITRVDFKGQNPEDIIQIQGDSLGMDVSGQNLVVFSESGEYVLYDLEADGKITDGIMTEFEFKPDLVSLHDLSFYVLQDSELHIYSPPFFDLLRTSELPITGANTISVSETGLVAIASPNAVAISTNAGYTWNTTRYNDWRVNGVVAGKNEVCVYGVNGEVHFSKDGIEWRNDFRRFKELVKDVVVGRQHYIITTHENRMFLLDREQQLTEIQIEGAPTLDTIVVGSYVGGLFGDELYAVVGDSTIMWLNADNPEPIVQTLSHPVFAIAQWYYNGENAFFALGGSSLYKYKNGTLVNEILIDTGSIEFYGSRLNFEWEKRELMLLNNQGVWIIDKTTGELEPKYIASDSLGQSLWGSGQGIGAMFGDSLYYEFLDWYDEVRMVEDEVVGFSGMEDWSSLTCLPLTKDYVFYPHPMNNNKHFVPISPIGSALGYHFEQSYFVGDSGTIGKMEWYLPGTNVQEIGNRKNIAISISEKTHNSIEFEIEDIAQSPLFEWQLADLNGRVALQGSVHSRDGKARIRCVGIARGLYTLSVVGVRDSNGVFKILFQ